MSSTATPSLQPTLSLPALTQRLSHLARQRFATSDTPQVVVSPYRFNPLGAHIDHQGGSVLARTLNQYSVGAFYPVESAQVIIAAASFNSPDATFSVGDSPSGENWHRYAMATAAVFNEWFDEGCDGPTTDVKGFNMVVEGTMVGAGLSSSASIILAYLTALAASNQVTLDNPTLVELTRRVENEHMGLNNGVQDQMSVVFGQSTGLSLLHVDDVDVSYWPNPDTIQDTCWLVFYSGFSRELVSSGFNDRVSECRQAAQRLYPTATRLGDVPESHRSAEAIAQLPDPLARRARHVYSEMRRVKQAQALWEAGDWDAFGALMNLSCLSSIEDYECGSEPMHYLHTLAKQTQGVLGSRFSGGGYGGCLIMLIQLEFATAIGESMLSDFTGRFPEKAGVARVFVAENEGSVRLV